MSESKEKSVVLTITETDKVVTNVTVHFKPDDQFVGPFSRGTMDLVRKALQMTVPEESDTPQT